MTREEFIATLKKTLHTQENITPQTVLADIPEWDSLGLIITMALVNKECNIKVLSNEMQHCVTIEDILHKVGL